MFHRCIELIFVKKTTCKSIFFIKLLLEIAPIVMPIY